MEDLQHFCDQEHPLVFEENERSGYPCSGCWEPVYGPSYYCPRCYDYFHHKSCAELPLGLHHPLHPKHPLILFPKWRYAEDDVKEYSKCEVCKEDRNQEYRYRCSRCDFNLHIRCASLQFTMESEVHDHPLTRIWKFDKFTCDLCGKEGSNVVRYLCALCNFWTHKSCASCLRRVKVIRHKHPLDLIHSLEDHQSDSRFCQICVQKVDTDYGLYYCSECDFIAHLDCAMDKTNREELIDEESTESKTMLENQSVDSAAYKVKEFSVGKDGTEIATEIEHFSHVHDLKLSDEVQINEICDGCVRTILPPFYSCGKCSFFLHKSCVELPRKKRHLLHQHPLTLYPNLETHAHKCYVCQQNCNRFLYYCGTCYGIILDVQCSLISDIFTHPGHEHRLILSSKQSSQNCSCCDNNINPIFRCTTCEFALDFRCATLPLTARYKEHEHPFTLSYTAEDDSDEYYCDICEEERNPKHWFYYCKDCTYLAHPECILGKEPNVK